MQSSLFSIESLGERDVHVAGLGALGRPIAECLYRKRVHRLHLWDFDVVEARNCFNQRLAHKDVGMPKIEAHARAFREIYPDSPTELVLHQERITEGSELSGFVLCAVDWNRIRYQEIWPAVFRQRDRISFFCDGRVGIDGGKAYGVDPTNINHVHHYTQDPLHNHLDPEGGEADAACKSDFPMPECADAVAAEVLWRMTRWMHLEQGSEDPYDNYVGWQNIPRKSVITEQWDKGTVRQMHTFTLDGQSVD